MKQHEYLIGVDTGVGESYAGITRSWIDHYWPDQQIELPTPGELWRVAPQDKWTAQRMENVTKRLNGQQPRTLTHYYRCRNCLTSWWQEHSERPCCEKCRSLRVKRLNKR